MPIAHSNIIRISKQKADGVIVENLEILPSLSVQAKPQVSYNALTRDKKVIAVSGTRKAGKTVMTTALGNIIAGAGKQVAIVHFDYRAAENPGKFLNLIRRIEADYILVDLGAGSTCGQLDLFNAADFGIMVLLPDSVSIESGYHFMQLCIYRRLLKAFEDDPSLTDFFQQSFDMIANDQGSLLHPVDEQIRELGPEYYERWQRAQSKHRLRVILNQIKSEQDCLEALTLHIAAQHILNLDLHQIYYVHDDLFMRRCSKQMMRDILSSAQEDNIADLFKVADEILAHGQIAGVAIDSYSAADSIRTAKICSVKCSYWGAQKCVFEKNGFACPMALVHYN